jgi:hypothetical protein
MAASMVARDPIFGARYKSRAQHGHARHEFERGIDEQTLEIRAFEVSGCGVVCAALMLPEPLLQITADVEIFSVTADRASDTRKCRDAIADLEAY